MHVVSILSLFAHIVSASQSQRLSHFRHSVSVTPETALLIPSDTALLNSALSSVHFLNVVCTYSAAVSVTPETALLITSDTALLNSALSSVHFWNVVCTY